MKRHAFALAGTLYAAIAHLVNQRSAVIFPGQTHIIVGMRAVTQAQHLLQAF